MLLGFVSPPKQPAETFITEIDFANELDVGETIIAQAATARQLSNGVDVTGTFLSGDPGVFELTKVRSRVVAGLPGERYRVQMQITTSSLNIYEHEFDVPVEEV